MSIDLSIIIPTYNRLPLLQEALDSFVDKLSCSYEVIIVDDGSTDGTIEYLQTLNEPCRFFLQAHKGGNAARNNGLSRACGDYVKFLDDDDLLDPSTTDAQVVFLNKNPDVNVCYSDWGQIIESDENIQANIIHHYHVGEIEDAVVGALTNKLTCPFTYLIRRPAALRVMWDETLPAMQDHDFILRLALVKSWFGYVPTCGGYNRVHTYGWGKVSMMDGKKRANYRINITDNTLKLINEQGVMTAQRRQAIAQVYFDLAEQFFLTDRRLFRQLIQKTLTIWPDYQANRPRFQFLARIFGYEIAEWLSVIRSRISQHLSSTSRKINIRQGL
ncbi:MAG TPA: glycosyltransferase [Aggregatilineaceae bacterium]|nr:glycosyltransferase [Aggregatilineaceae bacterium]